MIKLIIKLLVIQFLTLTMAYSQVLDVTDLYPVNKYYFPHFEYLGSDDGFYGDRISALVEDHRGYVWIGTLGSGLVKYNGYTYYSFVFDPSNTFSLPGNDIVSIFEDSRKILWVGTDNGLCYYQPGSNQFITVKFGSSNDLTEVFQVFSKIEESEDGDLFLNSNIGITVLRNIKETYLLEHNKPTINIDSIGASITQIKIPEFDKILGAKTIRDMTFDQSDKLWILTNDDIGILAFTLPNRLHQVVNDNINGTYQLVADIESGDEINIDKENVLWVYTKDYLVNIRTGLKDYEVTKIPNTTVPYKDDFKNNGKPDKRLWLGSYWNDLIMYEDAGKKEYPLTFKTEDVNTLYQKKVSCFLRTRSDVIFIGTKWGGLFKFNPKTLLSYTHANLQNLHLQQKENLRFVYEDSKGFIWLISHSLYRCNPNTGEILETFDLNHLNKKYYFANKMLEDSKGRFWVGMEYIGLYFLDIQKDKKTTKSDYHHVIDSKTVTSLIEDSNKHIWVATNFNNEETLESKTELYKIDQDGKILATYLIGNWNEPYWNDAKHFIYQIYADKKGFIWLATGFGLIRFSEDTHELINYSFPESDSISVVNDKLQSICPDPKNPGRFLWLGSDGGGLLCFDIEHSNFKISSQKPGLPSNKISSILADDSGNLWIGTDRGIARAILNNQGGNISEITIYNISDGLITSNFTNYYGANALKTKSGNLIFSGPKGFQIFDPKNIISDEYFPFLEISNLWINYEPANFGQSGSPLKQPVSLTKYLSLPYDQNTLGFEATALDFRNTDQLTYAFKLENYDNDWIVTQNSRVVQYTKLPPGNYTLKVKVANHEGVWIKEDAELKIQIEKPWWANNYVYLLYAGIIIAVFLFLLRVQIGKQKMEMKIELNEKEALKLKELDKMKSRFFANISHEFKTPLTLILNPVENMLNNEDKGTDRESLLMIQRNAKQLQQYITEILELSMLEANQLVLSLRKLDIIKYARYMLAAFESLAKQNSISLKFSSSHKELFTYLDPSKINIIISNLISNAIKFTPKGGQVALSVSTCDCTLHEYCIKEKGCVIITVTDTGIGIPADQLHFIWDRYYKCDNVLNENSRGTGLGLNLVRELVHLHLGSIDVSSKENQFTKFRINLPVGLKTSKPGEIVNSIPYEMEEEFEWSKVSEKEADIRLNDEVMEIDPKIILIIEDNKDLRKILRIGLKKEYKVIEAHDGEAGIQSAIETCPDLIICDVMMPKKDGFEVARNLKSNEITSHIPIILLTALSEMSDRLTGLEIGADEYIVKPFYSKELKVRVNNLIKQREKLKAKYSRFNSLQLETIPDKSIDQIFIEKVLKIVESNMADENFDIQLLMSEIGMSRTQLHRKLKALTNQSTSEFIQNIRLQRASEMIKNKVGNLAEIGYKIGFSNPSSFTRAFKQHFGHSPSEHIETIS